MTALTILLGAVVLLLAVLVAGLLRSHADILKALHDLGVGVGDPAAGSDSDRSSPAHRRTPGPESVPVTMGPPLPVQRDTSSVPTVAGVTPDGDALAVVPTGTNGLTLLAFLSSGCATCGTFWDAFRRPTELALPPETRLVVVTKGPDREIPAEVGARTVPGLAVVMSSDAWSDYEVPGSPFFVLIDGAAGRRIGEGVANSFTQVAELVHRARIDSDSASGGKPGRARAVGLDGPERELANDQMLVDAGILPGDPSLYPRSLDALYATHEPDTAPSHLGRAV